MKGAFGKGHSKMAGSSTAYTLETQEVWSSFPAVGIGVHILSCTHTPMSVLVIWHTAYGALLVLSLIHI